MQKSSVDRFSHLGLFQLLESLQDSNGMDGCNIQFNGIKVVLFQ